MFRSRKVLDNHRWMHQACHLCSRTCLRWLDIMSPCEDVARLGSTYVDIMFDTPEENVQRVERLENVKQFLQTWCVTQCKFDMVNVNLPCQEDGKGTDFIVLDMKVLKNLSSKPQRSPCGNPHLELSKEKKKYGLALKLMLECSTSNSKKKCLSSPMVSGDANIF